MAITLKEMLGSFRSFDIQILGTDISSTVLERASRGSYSPLEVSRGLSPERLQRFFVPQAERWVVSEELRALVSFRRLNLLEPAPDLGAFDIVLCRNLAIYFSPANRAKLFSNIAARMRRGGSLIVSLTENLGPKPAPYVRCEYRGVAYYELG